MGLQLRRKRFLSVGKLVGASLATVALAIQPIIGTLPTASALAGDDVYVSTTGAGAACTHAAPCGTIAAALAVVNDGGTVHVANGTYTETVTVTKPVTVKSDHGRANVTLNGSIKVDHDDVTVRGFTIQNPTGSYGVLVNDVDNVIVTSNAFTNIGSAFASASAVQAVYVLAGSSHISVDHNTFASIGETTNNSSNKAIYVGDSNNGPSTDVAINYNTIDGVTSTKGAYGVLVNHQVTGLVLTHNTIKNLTGGWAHAVGLEANTPGAVVTNNSINYVSGGLDSVGYRYETNPGALTTTMTSDSFNGHQATNSTSAIAVDATWGLLDAAVATNTYPEVYFHGKYYYYGINAFASIEQGLAHVAAGGTVYVESGTYSDVRATGSYASDVTVKGYSRPTINGLDLTGASFDGLTFQNFTFIGDSNGYGNFTVTISNDGTYKDLAFVGNIFDGQGIASRGAIFLNRGFDGFALQNNTFKNYNGSPVGTVYSVVFAEAQSGTSGSNYQATGNKLRTSTATNFLEAYRWANVTYDSNDVNAQTGRLLVWSDDAFALGTVAVTNNTIKVRQGTGIGIYYAPAAATVTGNTVDGAESCMKLDSVSAVTATGNTFKNCSVNGVKFSQNGATGPVSAVISSNTFTNGPVGIENTDASFAPAVCDNTFTSITTNLYEHPGPFNTVACQAPTLLSPANGAIVNGASITNQWSSVPGAVKYQYQSYDNSNLTGLRWDHEYAGTSKTATNVADGTVFYWRVRAIDGLGNTSPWSDLWQVVVDNVAPTVSIDAPSDGAVLQGPVDVIGSVSDAHPHHYWLQIKKNGSTIYNQTTNESNSFTGRLLQTLTDEGDYEVTLAARDATGGTSNSGNRSADVVVHFTIDNTAPVIAITSAVRNSDGTLTVNGTTDDTSDVTVTIDGVDTYTVSPTAGAWTVTTSVVANTSHQVAAESTDTAGNTSTAGPVSVARDEELNTVVTNGVIPPTPAPAIRFFGAPQTPDGNNGQAVLGSEDATSTNEGAAKDQDVKGTSDVKDTTQSQAAGLFGLAWYWWLLIVAGLVGVWWAIARWRHSATEQ